MRILVTGCSGLVGLNLLESLANKGYLVIGYDQKGPVYESPNFIFEQGDLCDNNRIFSVLNSYKADCIVHCGGISHPKIGTSDQIIQSNINGTVNIFEAAKKFNIKRVINLSSGAVYGQNQLEYTNEDTPLVPTSIYGVSKVAGEQIAKIYNESYGLEIISLRVCFVYGPLRSMPDPLKSILERLVRGESVKDEHGADQELEFIYVKDVVRCIEKIIELGHIERRVYNIGCEQSVTLTEIAQIARLIFPNSTIQIGPGKLGYDVIGPFDCSRAKQDLNFLPSYSLEEGIREYAQFLKGELKNQNI